MCKRYTPRREASDNNRLLLGELICWRTVPGAGRRPSHSRRLCTSFGALVASLSNNCVCRWQDACDMPAAHAHISMTCVEISIAHDCACERSANATRSARAISHRKQTCQMITGSRSNGAHRDGLCPLSKQKSRSCAAYPLQGSLYSTLDCFPTTAGSAQFCLLCCQPEPVPESLPARPPSLTRGCPCSLPVWSGQSIHMVHRTYTGPRHSISQTPIRGTERCDPPQMR